MLASFRMDNYGESFWRSSVPRRGPGSAPSEEPVTVDAGSSRCAARWRPRSASSLGPKSFADADWSNQCGGSRALHDCTVSRLRCRIPGPPPGGGRLTSRLEQDSRYHGAAECRGEHAPPPGGECPQTEPAVSAATRFSKWSPNWIWLRPAFETVFCPTLE